MRNDPPAMPRDLGFDDIQVGSTAEFSREITAADIADFARLSGDHNPLHVDAAYGAASPFGSTIAHGFLLGSLLSTLVGMYCPGKRSLYVSQTLNFKNPVRAGEKLLVRGVVTDKSASTRLVTLKTEIRAGDRIVLDGEAKVRMLS